MAEALAGLDIKAAVKAIAKAGYLRRDSQGKSTISIRPPGVPKKIRLFEISASILGAGFDQEGDTRLQPSGQSEAEKIDGANPYKG
jgi:hypothetical protein